MRPNEQPSRSEQPTPAEARRPVHDETLKHGHMNVERKTFAFALKENQRGRFLRVTENAGGRITNLMIPSSGLEEFKNVMDEMIQASNELPE